MVACRSGDAHGSAEVTRTGWASAMSQRRFCGGGPRRVVQNRTLCRTGRHRRTVRYRKRPCGVREVHLSAVAARAEVTAAQVRRKARHRTARHSRHHTARQLPDTHEARTIQARSTHDTGTGRRKPTLGPAPPKANTLPHTQSGQGGCRFTEKMVIFVSNEYCTIQPSVLLHLEHRQ